MSNMFISEFKDISCVCFNYPLNARGDHPLTVTLLPVSKRTFPWISDILNVTNLTNEIGVKYYAFG